MLTQQFYVVIVLDQPAATLLPGAVWVPEMCVLFGKLNCDTAGPADMPQCAVCGALSGVVVVVVVSARQQRYLLLTAHWFARIECMSATMSAP